MDGYQECLRESRGDRVMSHDSAPVLMQAPGMQFVLSLSVCTASLREVVLIYGYCPPSLATLWPSVVHFANNLGNRITVEHIQVP